MPPLDLAVSSRTAWTSSTGFPVAGMTTKANRRRIITWLAKCTPAKCRTLSGDAATAASACLRRTSPWTCCHVLTIAIPPCIGSRSTLDSRRARLPIHALKQLSDQQRPAPGRGPAGFSGISWTPGSRDRYVWQTVNREVVPARLPFPWLRVRCPRCADAVPQFRGRRASFRGGLSFRPDLCAALVSASSPWGCIRVSLEPRHDFLCQKLHRPPPKHRLIPIVPGDQQCAEVADVIAERNQLIEHAVGGPRHDLSVFDHIDCRFFVRHIGSRLDHEQRLAYGTESVLEEAVVV